VPARRETNYFWPGATIHDRASQERRYTPTMFAFFSNRLGCLGSIAVSVIGTIILIVLMRGCQM
jgi:hypothetical protein